MKCAICDETLSPGGLCPRCEADYGAVNIRLLRGRQPTMEQLETLCAGLNRIDYVQFKRIVQMTTHCKDDYVAAGWAMFHSDRFDYCMSRDKESGQGAALIELAFRLGRK